MRSKPKLILFGVRQFTRFLQIKYGCSKPPTVSSSSCKISSQKKIPSVLRYKVTRRF